MSKLSVFVNVENFVVSLYRVKQFIQMSKLSVFVNVENFVVSLYRVNNSPDVQVVCIC